MSENQNHSSGQTIKSKMSGQIQQLKEKARPCVDKIRSYMPQDPLTLSLAAIFISSILCFMCVACCSKDVKCGCKDAKRFLWFFVTCFAVSRILSTIALAVITTTIMASPGIFWLTGKNVPLTLSSYFVIVFTATIGLMFVKGMWKRRGAQKIDNDNGNEVPPAAE